MEKRGQINSEIFMYVLTIVIVGFILVIGYKYIGSQKAVIDKGQILQLQSKIASDIKVIGKDYGTLKKFSYSVPKNLEQVCLVDLEKKNEILTSKLVTFYPSIMDSLKTDSSKNIFFIGGTEAHSSYIDGIAINHYPHMVCFNQKENKIDIALEGQGNDNSQILADFVTKATTSQNKKIVLQSADNLVTLEIPEDAVPANTVVSIEMIEPPSLASSSGASDVYRFGPSGLVFNKTAELKIKYNPNIVGACPSELVFYQFNEDGSQIFDTESKSIDCDGKIAIFELDRLI